MKIPTYEESKAAVLDLTATPLQKFIYEETPQFHPDAFRALLQAVIAAAQHAAYEQARADAIRVYFDAPDEEDPDNAIRYMPNPYTVFSPPPSPACPHCRSTNISAPTMALCLDCNATWPMAGEAVKPDAIDDAMGGQG